MSHDNEAYDKTQEEVFTIQVPATVEAPSDSQASAKDQKKKSKHDRLRMALAICGFIVSVAIVVVGFVLGDVAKNNKENKTSFRLPDTLAPISYHVELQPFVNGNYSIEGYVKVKIKVLKSTNVITLHMADIITYNDTVKVTSYKAKTSKLRPVQKGETYSANEEEEEEEEGVDVSVTKHEYDPEKEWYVAHLRRKVAEGSTVDLSMRFSALLNDNLKGFYRSSYTTEDDDNRMLAVSFFSPINARRAFPCFDEPSLKATFSVSLARHTSMTALANMPVNATEEIDGQEGWVWDHFKPTLPMSTYIVAFLVSDFESMTNGNVSVWSRSEVLPQASHVLHIAPRLMEFFEGYLGVSYPMPKLDLVAIPDFAAGAMENWGLVTFREGSMLLPAAASAEGRQRVSVVTAHELAHQWFGNLVTAAWWTDILLKEGMAAFMENVGVNELEPSWGMMEQMVLTKQRIMASDGLLSTHPVNQPVSRPADIGQVFDSITYSKGVSVIRMLYHILREDTFKEGLNNYLNQYQYQAATQDDFWAIMTAAARNKSDEILPDNTTTVKEVMDTWTLQPGYPVLTVDRSYDDHTATLTQERFLLVGEAADEDKDEAKGWWLPLSYTSANKPNFTKTTPNIWMPASVPSMILEHLPNKTHWVLFNIQGTGFYRVNYDEHNWKRLEHQLLSDHSAIEVTSRATLLDDALSLARSGRLNYSIGLSVISYMKEEKDYIPWDAAMSGLSYIEKMMSRTEVYGRLKHYLLKLVSPLYAEVGYRDDLNDPHLRQRLRSLAVSWACKLGHRECLENASMEFMTWITNDTIADNDTLISPNLKKTVYCVGVSEGGEEAWEAVWERYLQTEEPREKTNLLAALGCSKELWILQKYLKLAFTEDSGIRKQDATLVFSSVCSNDLGRDVAWDFLRTNWEHVNTYYDTFSSVASLLSSVTQEFNTPIQQEELETFARQHEASLSTSSRAVKIARENVAGNVAWMNNYYQLIANWLQEEEEEDEWEVE